MQETPNDLSNLLSADIRLLGNLLGNVIREQHNDAAFDLVEKVRQAAKARRRGDQTAAAELRTTIENLDLDSLRVLSKAFTNYFQLINIAEDQQRIRVLRQREAKGALPESIETAIVDLKKAGIDAAAMRTILNKLSVRLVVTAHPSEAKRKEVLIKLRHIAETLGDMEGKRCSRVKLACWNRRSPKKSKKCGKRALIALPVPPLQMRSILACTSSRRR